LLLAAHHAGVDPRRLSAIYQTVPASPAVGHADRRDVSQGIVGGRPEIQVERGREA
jgi:hypothetical protein